MSFADRPLVFVSLCCSVTRQQWGLSRHCHAGAVVVLFDLILPKVIQSRHLGEQGSWGMPTSQIEVAVLRRVFLPICIVCFDQGLLKARERLCYVCTASSTRPSLC